MIIVFEGDKNSFNIAIRCLDMLNTFANKKFMTRRTQAWLSIKSSKNLHATLYQAI